MKNSRLQKVSRLIQKDMGEILRMEYQSLFNGAIISVTKVSVSADLALARLYVSIFATNNTTKEFIFSNLVKNKKKLRNLLSQRVKHQLRIIPDLAFFIDDSLDYAENIDKLLEQ